jgi:16S rRNA processing protein RimM
LNKIERDLDFVSIGRISRTHGVRGALKVVPYGETLGEQSAGEKLFLNPDAKGVRPELTLAALRPQGKFWVVQFHELSDMDAAQRVVGEELFVPEDRLSPTEEGEYYHFQLLGLSVVTVGGRYLGILERIMETGANDVYVVNCEGKELLVPAVEGIICEVDLALGKMVIDPPEGLMDDL